MHSRKYDLQKQCREEARKEQEGGDASHAQLLREQAAIDARRLAEESKAVAMMSMPRAEKKRSEARVVGSLRAFFGLGVE